MRKTTEQYWNDMWAAEAAREPFSLKLPPLRRYVRQPIHDALSSAFAGMPANASLLEVGCGNSSLLPYFAGEFGLQVTGLDYSPEGCRAARAILAVAGARGTIVQGDMFNPPAELLGQFDVVFSNGLVEHFDPTEEALRALARFLKPGGLIVSFVPNLAGWAGAVQQRLDRAVFDIHVVLDSESLAAAHRASGFERVNARYMGSNNFMICNAASYTGAPAAIRKLCIRALTGVSLMVWLAERIAGRRFETRALAAQVACTGRLPGGTHA